MCKKSFFAFFAVFLCVALYGNASTKEMLPYIILDAGHGGTDQGTKMLALQEKRITLITTLLTRKYLDEMGYRVILTRSRDVSMSLASRVSLANKSKGSLFVSIHFNSAPNKQAHGIEVFYHDSADKKRARSSKRLADCILYQLIDQTEARSRGVKRGNHYVTREATMPAILVEGGFISNQEERSLLKKKDYLEKVAKGIAQGVDKYLKS